MIIKIKEYYTYNKIKINMIFSLIIICLVFILIFIYFSNNNSREDITLNTNELITISESYEDYIFVDVKGNVNNEGVYKMKNGTIVNDVIVEAGGLKKNSNTRFINLAKKLNDGDVIVIYTNSEIEEAKKNNIIYVDVPCVCEQVENDSCIQNNINNDKILININTATMEELMSLDGIGESKATSIINFRKENGNFNNIKDIINVSGISETIFNKIKNNITT